MKVFRFIIVIAIVAVVAAVVAVRGRRGQKPVPQPPRDAAELTQNLIEERMADPAYTNGLTQLATQQNELAGLRYNAMRELAAWREGFVASNETARAIGEKIKALAAEGAEASAEAIAKLTAEIDALVAADPQGKSLRGKLDAIEAAIRKNQAIAKEFISARVREQAHAHAAEEKNIKANQ